MRFFLYYVDDGKDDTEGEEFQKAREMRREEVRLQPLPSNLPTDTETEVSLHSFIIIGNVIENNHIFLYFNMFFDF